MENHQGRAYYSSQDQFILSLDQQIQALLPLKDSYVALQHYQHKIMQEYQTLIHDQVSPWPYSGYERSFLSLQDWGVAHAEWRTRYG